MITQKLDILKESNVIDQEIYSFILKVIDSLKEQGINESEQTETFLIHLAMAAARRKNEEQPIEPLSESIQNDMMSDSRFSRAQDIWDILKNISPFSFGEEETGYFHLHICSML